ncbi:cytochrome P450 [Gautieria morchelliformis]|nr:cytochrome P450 [Gautieria morchelliformis]
MNVAPFETVKKSILSLIGSKNGGTGSTDHEKAVREAGSSLYLGGSDTEGSNGVDAAVGPIRLPEFEDRDNLPYINAIRQEILQWQILHDEAMYGPDTRDFKPERFLKPCVKYPDAAFGYGWRICPGRYMANNSMFIAVASILHVSDIAPARDSSGKEIPINKAFTSGFFVQKLLFLKKMYGNEKLNCT